MGETTMTFAESIMKEFEQAWPVTRRHLERIPADKLNWMPAPKSMIIGQLGLHLAETPGNFARMAAHDTFEMPDFTFPEAESVEQILEASDASVEAVAAFLKGMDD